MRVVEVEVVGDAVASVPDRSASVMTLGIEGLLRSL